MGCRAYRILATMGFGTVGIRVKFPHGRPIVHFCVLPPHGYWVLDGTSDWKIEFLDSSTIVVSVHAWREPLAPLHLATHLFISHNISL